jgi:hypothetical protein
MQIGGFNHRMAQKVYKLCIIVLEIVSETSDLCFVLTCLASASSLHGNSTRDTLGSYQIDHQACDVRIV